MTLTNMDRNVLRTVVPSIVGAVVTYVTKLSAHLTPAEQAILFPAATSGYYMAVRYLEERFPKLSFLLGCLPVKVQVAADTPSPTLEVPTPTAPTNP